VGGDPHDPTTTRETRRANAIAEPTPDGYRPCWRKISLITKINSYAQSKNEHESEASNLNITQRWSSESQRTARICACSGVAKARCKTKLESENKRGVYLNRGRSPWWPRGAALQYPWTTWSSCWANSPKGVGAAPCQILDVNLFHRFPLTQNEFWHGTSSIGRSMKLCFQPYIERPKPTLYATWASVLLRTAPGL
jgi:hypothetical protein